MLPLSPHASVFPCVQASELFTPDSWLDAVLRNTGSDATATELLAALLEYAPDGMSPTSQGGLESWLRALD